MGVLSPLCDGQACAAAVRPSSSELAVQMLVEHLSKAQDGCFLGVRISRLNPRFICFSDFLTLSHRKTFCVSFTHPGPWGTGPGCAELAYQYTNAGVKPFPPHARDFLYSPDALAAGRGRPSAHHLRQRRPPRPKTYACLRECRGKSASPRSRPQKFSRLREQLLRAGMAPKAFISRCRAIFGNRRNIHPELTVWGLQHPFLVNLGTSLCLTIVGPAAAHETELQPLTEWILR
ncbi:hypothetical protein C8J57DRAFT_163227 [Mycena rebaudengoi]|nr:hypothetical protein C8J57DRAFT_163227 [Mycena rebaudengoi]